MRVYLDDERDGWARVPPARRSDRLAAPGTVAQISLDHDPTMSIPDPPPERVFDLGAYVLGPNREQVLSLLSARIGAFVLEYASDDGTAMYGCGDVVLTLSEGGDGFLNVYLVRCRLWSDDVAFARYLAQALDCVVRCDPGAEYPEVSPLAPVFLEIRGDGESLVVWDEVEDEDDADPSRSP